MGNKTNILVNCWKHFLLLYKHFIENADIFYRIDLLQKSSQYYKNGLWKKWGRKTCFARGLIAYIFVKGAVEDRY